MFVLLRIRDGGWFFGPRRWLTDHGSHYDFDVTLIKRRIYKGSIDREYAAGWAVAIILVPAITMYISLRVAIACTRFVLKTMFGMIRWM